MTIFELRIGRAKAAIEKAKKEASGDRLAWLEDMNNVLRAIESVPPNKENGHVYNCDCNDCYKLRFLNKDTK